MEKEGGFFFLSIHAILENYEYKLLTKIYMIMKKILFLCASLFLVQSINAQISEKPSVSLGEKSYLYLTSPSLAANDNPIIYTFVTNEKESQTEITIFDNNLSVIKEFVAPYGRFERTITLYFLEDDGSWRSSDLGVSDITSYPAEPYYDNPSAAIDDHPALLTQTFFNDDDNYEYIVPIVEKGNWEYIEPTGDEKYAIDGYAVVGIKVVNDKGTEVCSLRTGARVSEYDWEVDFYTIGDNNYLTVGNEFYKVDKLRSSLTKVAMPERFSVSPKVARRNTLVNVSFDASDSPRAIKVIGGNGMECQKINVVPGTESVGVDTSRLSPGVYVVMMSEGGKNVEKCKIVVR
ncbi:hypothetical protein E5358_00465 [Palleniella muris]|uniref:Uncharacterized protein n=1 Tax=Palleniella muris TaxID=3038145 RepID=A0AC61QUD0_9BACT|nr:hypothetical protein [Palleniella muris]TGX84146.1 hypothetical protein E5358_00465 [Palleniella muris]